MSSIYPIPKCKEHDGSKKFCIKCEKGFGMGSNFTACVECYASKDSSLKCYNCDGDIQKCNLCPEGTALDDAYQCNTCPYDCKICQPLTMSCYYCENGFGLNTSGACKQCTLPDCASCVIDAAGAEKCFKCKADDYVITGDGCKLCSDAIAGCSQCIYAGAGQPFVCGTCDKNYTAVNGKCKPACYTPETECTTCENTHFLSNGECIMCSEALFEQCNRCVSAELCTDGCALGCASCFGKEENQCVTCKHGYVWKDGSCKPCSSESDSCVCGSTLYPHCTKCSEQKCGECGKDYYLAEGECVGLKVFYKETAMYKNIAIILGSIGGALLIAFISALVVALVNRATRYKKATKTPPKVDFMQSIYSLNDMQ